MDGDGVRARAAAANNADLYAAVFAAQGRRFCRDAALFRAIDPPPPCYSSVTTLDPGATAEQLAAIDALQAEGRADVGVKDGFCRLDRDLAARGLAVLFEASWLWAPAAFEAAAGPAGWERVTSPWGSRRGRRPGRRRVRRPRPGCFPPRCWLTRPSPSSAGAAGRGMTPAASATARRAASGFPHLRAGSGPRRLRRGGGAGGVPGARRAARRLPPRRAARGDAADRLPRGRAAPRLDRPGVGRHSCNIWRHSCNRYSDRLRRVVSVRANACRR